MVHLHAMKQVVNCLQMLHISWSQCKRTKCIKMLDIVKICWDLEWDDSLWGGVCRSTATCPAINGSTSQPIWVCDVCQRALEHKVRWSLVEFGCHMLSQIFLALPVFFLGHEHIWIGIVMYCSERGIPWNFHISWTFMEFNEHSWTTSRCHEMSWGGKRGRCWISWKREIHRRPCDVHSFATRKRKVEERYRKMKKPWNQEKPRRKTEKNDTSRYRAVCFSWAPHLSILHILLATLHGTDRNVLWCVSPGAIVPNGSQWIPMVASWKLQVGSICSYLKAWAIELDRTWSNCFRFGKLQFAPRSENRTHVRSCVME